MYVLKISFYVKEAYQRLFWLKIAFVEQMCCQRDAQKREKKMCFYSTVLLATLQCSQSLCSTPRYNKDLNL